jgi:hypothetical protein
VAANLAQFVISAYDDDFALVTCQLCPKGDRTYAGRFTAKTLIDWIEEHWSFLHETQVAAREEPGEHDRNIIRPGPGA